MDNIKNPDYMTAAAKADQIAALMHEIEGLVYYEELSDMIGWTWTHETEKMAQLAKDLQKAADRAAILDIMRRRVGGQVMRVKSCRGPDEWREVTEVYPATKEIEIGGGGLHPEVIPISDVVSLMIDI